ncbi:unnamed protein product [Urochloa decumbens]|uniref:Uncharacterized protein n=1 Tax=Urochloa decumbens TaxID=240449 RepID=A0ABC9FAL9_9POAL
MARETGDTTFHEEKGLEEGGSKAYARCRCVQRRAGLPFLSSGRTEESAVAAACDVACTVALVPAAAGLRCVAVAQLSTGMGQRRGFCRRPPRFSNCSEPPLSETRRGDIRHGLGNLDCRVL